MSQSIVRFPKNPLVTGLAVTTRCVEYGFITAGATAAAFSALAGCCRTSEIERYSTLGPPVLYVAESLGAV